MENKLLWVPQLAHRDKDKQKCHTTADLEAENGDSTEWKIHKGTSPMTCCVYSLAALYTKRKEGKTATT